MKATERWTVAAVVAAIGVVAAAASLSWHRSGSVDRNAFALARVADGLDLVSGPARRVLFLAVLCLPLLAALAFLAAVAGRPRLVGLLTCANGLVGLASAVVILRLTGERQLGPVVGTAVALVAMGCGLRLVLRRKGPHG